ncbi:hypothetical protein Tco_0978030 [Tanacetum coccineum]|uniref:Reverse transcriptase domain-containing protein n=1 Tax=Tanacetum coccineum TaxID=301880 RepID=A0ABQ5ELS2_9ASTR
MTAHHNDWDTSAQRSESSSSITSSFDLEIVALKAEMAEINKNLMKVLQVNQQVKAVTPSCETCGGPHAYNDCPATVGQTQNVYAAGAYNQGGNYYQPQGASHVQNPPPAYQAPAYQAPAPAYQASPYQAPVNQASIPQPQVVTNAEFSSYMKANDAILKNMETNMTTLTNSTNDLKNMLGQFMKMNTASTSGSGTLSSNTITNPREDLKGITTRSGVAYKGPTIPTTSSSPKVVERETEVTKDTVPPTNNGGTEDVQPPVVQVETQVPNSEPVVAPVVEPVEAPVSAPKPNLKPSIPYPSRLNDQKIREKANNQMEKFSKSSKICISTLASRMLSFSCPNLLQPLRADFVVVDFDADPRVPLILGRSFLKTGRALIGVYEGELTLRVGNKAVTFNLDQTSRYSSNYDDNSVNRIDIIDVACEEYSQEVLGFSVMRSLKGVVVVFSVTRDDLWDSLKQNSTVFWAVHVNDASEILKPSWGNTCTLMLSGQLPGGIESMDGTRGYSSAPFFNQNSAEALVVREEELLLNLLHVPPRRIIQQDFLECHDTAIEG